MQRNLSPQTFLSPTLYSILRYIPEVFGHNHMCSPAWLKRCMHNTRKRLTPCVLNWINTWKQNKKTQLKIEANFWTQIENHITALFNAPMVMELNLEDCAIFWFQPQYLRAFELSSLEVPSNWTQKLSPGSQLVVVDWF